MPGHSKFSHYSLVTAAVAVLGGLIYLQFSQYLPDSMRVSNVKSLRVQHSGCALEEVPGDHLFVAASIWEGAIATDLTIGSPPLVAKLVRIGITPGDKPLTVFLSSYGTIWDFTGAVDRVQRVVAVSPVADRRIGVTGIAADRVDFPVLRGCKILPEALVSANETARKDTLAIMFGRRPEHAPYQSKALHVSLPNADFGVRPDQPAMDTPGSRTLDPDQVVSAVAIARPEVLPAEAGLKQLEAAGAIRKPTAEEEEEFVLGSSRPYRSKLSPDFRLPGKFDYVITREVTLPQPSHMQQWRFLVLAGVPSPRATGRMCIAQMDDFRVNNIDACFGETRQSIERLRDLPAVEKVADCRLLEPPEQAALEAVAVYGPEQAKRSLAEAIRSFDEKVAPHPIDVRVDKTGDLMLVLTSYDPAIWRVSAGADTRIVGVLLIGYHTSRVEGLGPETPVAIADHEGRARRPKPSPHCARLQFWLGGAYRGGPDALVLDRQVLALTGRTLDGLRGAYRLGTVNVR